MLARLVALAPCILALTACGARTGLVDDGAAPTCGAPNTEICDGLDNDCDGAIDEDIAPVRCGDGACQAEVRCEDGRMPGCTPRPPQPEACNLIDDDCDGQVDEGFGFGPLGEAIALRTSEGSSGDCSSCRWAWGTALGRSGDGVLAVWNLGLSGGAEQANLFGRRLDLHGAPVGPIELLSPDFVLQQSPMAALEPLPRPGLPLDVTLRIGSQDTPGILFLAPQGGTALAVPTPASGPSLVPRTVWSGERFVSAWQEQDRLRVAVLDADGVLEREVDLGAPHRPAAITLGVYPGRVGVLMTRFSEPDTREQWLAVLDPRGEVLMPLQPIDVAYATWQDLVGTAEGWLHVRPNAWDEPSTLQRLAADGAPLEAPRPFPDGRHLDDAGLQHGFFPRPEQHEALLVWQDAKGGDASLELLDDHGNPLRGWRGPLPDKGGAFASQHVLFLDQRVLVIWHTIAPDDQPNPVWVREFGCVP